MMSGTKEVSYLAYIFGMLKAKFGDNPLINVITFQIKVLSSNFSIIFSNELTAEFPQF